MRLKELQLTKDLKDPKSYPAGILQKYGWNVLGSGVNGSVAKHPNKNYVLKLFENDSSYIEFVKFILSYKNIHLPKIGKGAKQLPGTDYFYVTMEELTPVSDGRLMSIYFPEIIYLVVQCSKNQMGMNDILTDMVMDKLKHKYDSAYEIDLDQMFAELGEQPDNAWIELVDTIIDYGQSIGERYFDLHDENFMLRGNTLIINDPW